MAFHNLSDFIDMGGFAGYVWPAYLICAISLGLYAWSTRKQYHDTIKRLIRRYESNS